jgi:ATP-dependent helicase/nuclease subunit B
MSVRSSVFTIPPSQPFLKVLADALLDGRLVAGFAPRRAPELLADATVYLPTRRAVRAFREALTDSLGMEAAILPRLKALGEADDDPFAAAEPGAADLPPPLAPAERRLLLTLLVARYAQASRPQAGDARGIATGPAQAMALADELARLMDDMATRGVDWGKLDNLVPERFDAYWQQTLAFLAIARTGWPAILAERGASEPALHRDAMIDRAALRIAADPARPVIAAGSTGSMPATARFLAAIAAHPRGAVVLPGLDMVLDDASWRLIGGAMHADPAPSHPQFALHGLLTRLGLSRDDITTLAAAAAQGRERLTSEAMRPAATTDLWQGGVVDQPPCLDDVTLIEAAGPHDEALAAAMVLRAALEDPDATAALVTPDRDLATRVIGELSRWHVPVDDSGGAPLGTSLAGAFARLIAEAMADELAPVPLLCVLKHPLARFGMDTEALARRVSCLERAVLRGVRPEPGSTGLLAALDRLAATRGDLHASDPRRTLGDDDLDEARALVNAVAAAFGTAPQEGPLATLITWHQIATGAASTDPEGVAQAFEGLDGQALLALFDTHVALIDLPLPVTRADYPAIFTHLAGAETVRRPATPGARIRILGPLEARLQRFDHAVLAGLNEGTWPPETRTDAWLSRPMRNDLGLDMPERRIGLAAHDFCQLLGMSRVTITRAQKTGGAPAVPSRLLQRLLAVAGPDNTKAARERGAVWLDLARRRDAATQAPVPAPAPRPAPPLHLRPARLSVTEIETLQRDPFAIYARHVLKLSPLDPLDMEGDARERGTLIHQLVADYTARLEAGPVLDPRGAMQAVLHAVFAPHAARAEAQALWWPRLRRIAEAFVDWDAARRNATTRIASELSGRIGVLDTPRRVVLSGRADRIERQADGTLALVDFKTGNPPSNPQIESGLSPQLTLLAAMAQLGAFAPDIAAAPVREARHVMLKGRGVAIEDEPFKPKSLTFEDAVDAAWLGLKKLLASYEDENQPYLSALRPFSRNRPSDYAHLARVAEWSADSDGDEP